MRSLLFETCSSQAPNSGRIKGSQRRIKLNVGESNSIRPKKKALFLFPPQFSDLSLAWLSSWNGLQYRWKTKKGALSRVNHFSVRFPTRTHVISRTMQCLSIENNVFLLLFFSILVIRSLPIKIDRSGLSEHKKEYTAQPELAIEPQ